MTWTPNAWDILWALRRLGYSVRAGTGRLLIAPASRLSAEDREQIAAHRAGLLAILSDPIASLPDDQLARVTAALDRLPPVEWGASVGNPPHPPQVVQMREVEVLTFDDGVVLAGLPGARLALDPRQAKGDACLPLRQPEPDLFASPEEQHAR